ncbi:hypothetical protein HUZ36_16545 [Pseudoalteromonas sp. McH1-7]|uniref:Outer membrane protein beta-barrel domain-containing protein n=1 Tax=Pseudoalteromonas peptidolytica F12-50-A1 TaxID=1315280 RepID=A0A8I0T6P2_9GAMM|nr:MULTISPECIES: hypothetical protein [Pseudoalteromonas]MBE0348513.1 hypothetical protein [Pseudoalteromonas peptidolytica F12-50-A1]NLR17031.1 hypothetical protein [Pseudoalteromonas peptidolytica]NUZ12394.1 hypothetical protein [Pseudoalteromonas sp. McH1-7]RXE98993.1 hypothetical protein D9603_16860 [Pseudoalteromonas sp. PS5]GEK10000.1 hypothetical protein PPE03_22490 [Pseudoalteromonas peptidolytica]
MKLVTLAATLALTTSSVVTAADFGEFGISIYGGESFSSDIETSRHQKYELEDDSHFGISIDKYVPQGRYGFYYGTTETQLTAYPLNKVEMEYLFFQSAVVRPLTENLDVYLGAQIGATFVNPNFIDSDTFFATGLYTGLEYDVGAGFHFGAQVRWIATMLNNGSKVTCDLDPATENTCSWHFDDELMRQYHASATLSYRFSL